jgi:hypothetical protein
LGCERHCRFVDAYVYLIVIDEFQEWINDPCVITLRQNCLGLLFLPKATPLVRGPAQKAQQRTHSDIEKTAPAGPPQRYAGDCLNGGHRYSNYFPEEQFLVFG